MHKSHRIYIKKNTQNSDTDNLNGIKKRIKKLNSRGFIAASVDSILYKTDTIEAFIYEGIKYKWGDFVFNDSLKNDFSELEKMSGKRVDINNLEYKLNSIVTKKVSSGFPFFKLQLIPQILDDQIINCTIEANGYKTPIYIDTIVLPANAKISKGYLVRYLDINENDLYNYTALRSIEEKIERLSFITLKSPVLNRFSTQGAIIELPIDAKMAGSFGGMVGFATSEKENKLQITGDVSLKLHNAFKKGEEINLSWKRLVNQNQSLLIKAELPFLYGSPIGFYTNVNIQKIDTTIINTNNEFSSILYINGLNQFRIGINHRTNSFLLSNDTTVFDTKTVLYSGAFIFNNIDNWYNPTNGFDFEVDLKIGNRQQKDSSMSENTLYSIYTHCVKYWKISKKNVLLTAIDVGVNKTADKQWPNELFKLGGMYSMRGFDEESIYASKFIYSTVEYRFLFEKKSNAFAFFQSGGYKMISITKNIDSYLFSIGIGATVDTGFGAFTVVYALGKSNEYDLKLRNAKIHFGYLTRF